MRHDTVLYAKQSYTATDACYYPAGFVEPHLAFWRRLQGVALRAADLISTLPARGAYTYLTSGWGSNEQTGTGGIVWATNTVTLASIQEKQIGHLRRFADTLSTLQRLSEKELAQECFHYDEFFIRNLIQDSGFLPWGSGGVRKSDGWFPRLFYHATHFASFSDQAETTFQENYGVNAADQLVTDVHTDVPNPIVGDPGSVLHQGIGRVNLLLLAVERGSDRFLCAGPVLSHYEFEIVGEPRRLVDAEWSTMNGRGRGGGVLNNVFPADVPAGRVEGIAPPAWTRSYLVRSNSR